MLHVIWADARIALLTFYVQTWDEYHTHTLTLGVISGPVEGIVTLCVMYAITAYIGRGSFWQQSLFSTIGAPRLSFVPDLIYDLSWTQWWMAYGGFVLFYNTFARYATRPFHLPQNTKACDRSAQNVIEARRSRSQSPTPALLGLLPFAYAWTLIPLYLFLHPQILQHHLIPFIFYAGLINALSVGRIIIAHLTKSRFPFTNILLLPLFFGVVDGLWAQFGHLLGVEWLAGYEGRGVLGLEYQVPFVFMCFGFAVGVYGHFAYDCVVTICDYLDIWCLTIKHPHKEGEEKKAQ